MDHTSESMCHGSPHPPTSLRKRHIEHHGNLKMSLLETWRLPHKHDLILLTMIYFDGDFFWIFQLPTPSLCWQKWKIPNDSLPSILFPSGFSKSTCDSRNFGGRSTSEWDGMETYQQSAKEKITCHDFCWRGHANLHFTVVFVITWCGSF